MCCDDVQAEGARGGPQQAAHPHLPRGNMHQQHQRHAVQEGQLRGELCMLFHRQNCPFLFYSCRHCCGSKYIVFGSRSWNFTQVVSVSVPFHTLALHYKFLKQCETFFFYFINRYRYSLRSIFEKSLELSKESSELRWLIFVSQSSLLFLIVWILVRMSVWSGFWYFYPVTRIRMKIFRVRSTGSQSPHCQRIFK